MRMSMAPKLWKAKIVPTTTAKKMVGESMGTVTRQKRVQFEAPSTRAASSTSSGTDCRPAVMMMKASPKNCQMEMAATDGRAQVVFSSKGGLGLMPSQGKRPTIGFMRVPNTSEATATELTTVDEKMTRKAAMPFSLR